MPSISEFRKKVPMPKMCPFCGRQLTEDNSEVDHIVPLRLGGTDDISNMRYLCKACNARKSDKYNHLYEYYYRLMKNKGQMDEKSGKTLDYVLSNMSQKDIDALDKRVSQKDPAYNRLLAYATAFAKLSSNDEPNNVELADVMSTSLKAYDNYDVDEEKRIEINGNYFIYKEGFPIEDYRDILASYGEEEKDEVYSVYLDAEGRLVVY